MKPADLRQPRALVVIFFTEMWERFSFYGMRALLVLYLMDRIFNGDREMSFGVYAAYGSLVYATPFIGGWLADKFLGHQRSVIWGATLMMFGHFAMAFEHPWALYLALSLLIVGSGFFKPNMSTILGSLYAPNDFRRDSGFTIYYMSVNLGALLSPILCGIVGEKFGWGYGFGIAGVGMLCGLCIFLKFRHMLVPYQSGDEPATKTEAPRNIRLLIYLLSIAAVLVVTQLISHYQVVSYILLPLAIIVIVGVLVRAIRSEKIERDRLFVILILAGFSIAFFAFFEQAGSSLTLFAKDCVTRNVLGFNFPTAFFQSVNPSFILLFAPVLSALWIWLGARKKEPSIPVKFAGGMFFMALGFFVLVASPIFGTMQTTDNGTVVMIPALMLILSYLLQTLGELMLSPIGLSMITKLSPKNMTGMMMGVWHLADSLAFILSGILAQATGSGQGQSLEQYLDVFKIIGIASAVCGLLLLALSPKIKRMMHLD